MPCRTDQFPATTHILDGTTKSGTRILEAWGIIHASLQVSNPATSYQEITRPTVRDFQADREMGEWYEREYMRRKQRNDELWMRNPAEELDSMRDYDLMRVVPAPHIRVELKADLRARDRVAIEHPTLKHTKADIWVQWIEPLKQFYEIPVKVLQDLVVADERLIRAGKQPKHYRGRRSSWTGGTATFVNINEFIHLPNCQPA